MGRAGRPKVSTAQVRNGNASQAIDMSIEKNLRKLREAWEPKQYEGHNVFLEALAPDLVEAARQGQSIASKLGFAMESVSNEVANIKYPGEVRTQLLSSSLTDADCKELQKEEPEDVGWEPTKIWTRFNPKVVSEAASELTRYARTTSKIGQPGFRKKLLEVFQAVQHAKRASKPWKIEVDLACTHPRVGLVEIKSGGELDKTKAESETKGLIEAYLAYGDMELPICYANLYANNGEEKQIKGALPKYFMINNGLENYGGLMVGRQWWDHILPEDVSYEKFLQQYGRLAKKYELKI